MQHFRIVLMLALCYGSALGASKKHHVKPLDQTRAEYIARFQQFAPNADEPTTGSLWTPASKLGSFSEDYKAHHLHDTITIQVSVQTTAAQSATSDQERAYKANSAITGIMGRSPAATNPLIAGSSATTLKGQGSTASNTTFATNLTGQVIAVLPNGNLVVEAERQIFMNNQNENITLRGMLRPGDIGPGNIVPSAALSNLEIEMKGKGIIADGVRPPNPITKAVMWLLGF